MNKKSLIFSIFLAGIIFITMVVGLSAQEDQLIPEEISINNDGFKHERKGPVEFTHAEHVDIYEIACDECHHYYEDGKNIWVEGDYVAKCSECHDPLENDDDVENLRLAFHELCKDCHRDLSKQYNYEDAPFRKCRGCHEQ